MLTITPDFITPEQEQELLSHIQPSRVVIPRPERNKITRYGSKVPYKTRTADKIPLWLQDLCFQIAEEWKKVDSVPNNFPDSVTINEYYKGQSIDWHIDSPTSGPIITVLSLLSDANMGLKLNKDQKVQHLLPARSLVQMSGEERWKWKHCIYPVESLRYSIVFRKGTEQSDTSTNINTNINKG